MIVEFNGQEIECPDDMPMEEVSRHVMARFGTPRPDHEDLAGAAVTGADSMDLMDMDAEVKPVAKMTVDELLAMPERVADKNIFITQGVAYVMAPTVNASEAVQGILSGNDSATLGYPEKGNSDAAVTKDGEIVTDLGDMKEQAEAGNVIWAANGDAKELQDKAGRVVEAIYKGKKVKVNMTDEQIEEQERAYADEKAKVRKGMGNALSSKR